MGESLWKTVGREMSKGRFGEVAADAQESNKETSVTAERWQEIKQVYPAALELRAEQRAAYVDAACAEDSDLRREVESLLAQEGTADSFLQAPTLEAVKILSKDGRHSLLGHKIGS